jgi:ferredoxin
MRVVADFDRCEGNAVCLGIDPEIFDIDENDYVVIADGDVPPGHEALVEQAIAECPRAALLRKD